MKTMILTAVTLLMGANFLVAADKGGATFEGTLVSSVCYLNGKDHPTTNEMGGYKTCGSKCLKKGDPAGLVSKSGEFHVLVASSIKLSPYVGQQVRVTGEDHSGAIAVDKIEVSKSGQWQPIELRSGKKN